MRTTNLKVVGTYYYQAIDAFRAGILSVGSVVKLVADTNNPHDKNAVAVYSKNLEFKLGHLRKDYAKKYQSLILQNKIHTCKVYSSELLTNSVELKISVTYDENPFKDHAQISQIIPTVPGIYKISLGADKVYIGSTNNLKARCQSHLSALRNGTHKNNPLQKDFEKFGESHFVFDVINFCQNEKLLKQEADAIKVAVKNGVSLYNLTGDGRGYISNSNSSSNSITDRKIFDKSNARLTENANTRRQVDQNYELEKERVESFLIEYKTLREKELESINEAIKVNFVSRFKSATVTNPGYRGRSFIFGKFGFGRETYSNGDCYVGNFRRNKKEGHGTYRWSNGNTYAGIWIENRRTGLGLYQWNTGSIYKGEWLDGKQHGIGFFQSYQNAYWGIWRGGELDRKLP